MCKFNYDSQMQKLSGEIRFLSHNFIIYEIFRPVLHNSTVQNGEKKKLIQKLMEKANELKSEIFAFFNENFYSKAREQKSIRQLNWLNYLNVKVLKHSRDTY